MDHANRARALQVPQQAQRFAVVLAHLVGHVADPGVGHGQLGQLAVAIRCQNGPTGGGDQLVNPSLVVALGHLLRAPRPADQFGHGLISVAACSVHVSPP